MQKTIESILDKVNYNFLPISEFAYTNLSSFREGDKFVMIQRSTGEIIHDCFISCKFDDGIMVTCRKGWNTAICTSDLPFFTFLKKNT